MTTRWNPQPTWRCRLHPNGVQCIVCAKDRKVIHVLVNGRVLCGTRGQVAAVTPHRAKYVTCRRCIASLLKV